MFAYCNNNPVSRTDPAGSLWRIAIAIVAAVVMLAGCDALQGEVLVISNSEKGWMDSSQVMGEDMASAIGAKASYVEAVTNNFSNTWNETTANYLIIHTHGSPNGFFGSDLSFTTSDIGQLHNNSNINLVLITACEVGGSNGTNANMAQLISQKIAPNGIEIGRAHV